MILVSLTVGSHISSLMMKKENIQIGKHLQKHNSKVRDNSCKLAAVVDQSILAKHDNELEFIEIQKLFQ